VPPKAGQKRPATSPATQNPGKQTGISWQTTLRRVEGVEGESKRVEAEGLYSSFPYTAYSEYSATFPYHPTNITHPTHHHLPSSLFWLSPQAELGKLANTASHVNVGIIVIGIEELCLVCPGGWVPGFRYGR